MSSRPCVGCAWRPSPALTTWTCGRPVRARWSAIRKGAPELAWRTTNMSACIATRLSSVSSRVSPFAVEDRETSRLMTSADSRLAAISKVVRVRVEFSKKMLNTLLPRRSGTFFTSRPCTSRKDDAVSRMLSKVSAGKPSSDRRWVSSPLALSCGFGRAGAFMRVSPSSRTGGHCRRARGSDSPCAAVQVTRGTIAPPPATGAGHDRRGRPDRRRPAVRNRTGR